MPVCINKALGDTTNIVTMIATMTATYQRLSEGDFRVDTRQS